MWGWVNPFLFRTHAAPVQHCFTQNTGVQLCSEAVGRGKEYGYENRLLVLTESLNQPLNHPEVTVFTKNVQHFIWLCIFKGRGYFSPNVSQQEQETQHSPFTDCQLRMSYIKTFICFKHIKIWSDEHFVVTGEMSSLHQSVLSKTSNTVVSTLQLSMPSGATVKSEFSSSTTFQGRKHGLFSIVMGYSPSTDSV